MCEFVPIVQQQRSFFQCTWRMRAGSLEKSKNIYRYASCYNVKCIHVIVESYFFYSVLAFNVVEIKTDMQVCYWGMCKAVQIDAKMQPFLFTFFSPVTELMHRKEFVG